MSSGRIMWKKLQRQKINMLGKHLCSTLEFWNYWWSVGVSLRVHFSSSESSTDRGGVVALSGQNISTTAKQHSLQFYNSHNSIYVQDIFLTSSLKALSILFPNNNKFACFSIKTIKISVNMCNEIFPFRLSAYNIKTCNPKSLYNKMLPQ